MTEGVGKEDRRAFLELADPAEFYEVAFEVEELGVGFAELVGIRDLGAEAVHREGAVEQGDPQDPGLVVAGGVVGHERTPPALEIRPSELGAQAHGKAPGQRHVRPQPSPVPLAVPAARLGILLLKTQHTVHLHGREKDVGRAQGEHHERPFHELLLLVFPVLPGRPAAQPQAREEPVLHFQTGAEIVVEGGAAPPALTRRGQQAQFGIPAEQPARPHVPAQKRLVELAPLILPVVDVEPRAQAPAGGQGILVFGPAPAHHADTGTGLTLRTTAKREPVDIDDLRVRRGIDVRIRGQGEAEIPCPAAPGPHDVQKIPDVRDHRGRGTADQDPFEMVAGQVVILLEKKGQSQFQAHAHQVRLMDQDGPEGRNGQLQKQDPFVVPESGLLGLTAGRQAQKKPHFSLVRTVLQGQGFQDFQGFGKAVAIDQCPRSPDTRVGGQGGPAKFNSWLDPPRQNQTRWLTACLMEQ